VILRGEMYDVDFGEPVGHEPVGRRPSLVVSANLLNNGPGSLVGVVPITSTRYGLRSHIEIDDATTGLTRISFARCDQVRMVSTKRLVMRRGQASLFTMRQVDAALRILQNV